MDRVSAGTHPRIVRWPWDERLRGDAAVAGAPCLLVVPDGRPAPQVGRGEDWVRESADEREVAARLAQLAAVGRSPGSIIPPVLPVSMKGSARSVAEVLAAAPGELVPRHDLEEAAGGRLSRVLPTVRREMQAIGWTVDPVPGIGYVLGRAADA